MNDRKIKKRLKKTLRNKQPAIILYGNKNCDFVEIVPLKNDRIYLRCGCSCVVVTDLIVPNEFLSLLINDCMLIHSSVKNFIKSINCDEEYKNYLIEKLGKYNENDTI